MRARRAGRCSGGRRVKRGGLVGARCRSRGAGGSRPGGECEWVLVYIGQQEGGVNGTYGFIVVVEDLHV